MNFDKEPYIGMPIYLDDCDCDDIMDEILGESRPEPPCMAGLDFENWPIAMAYVPMQQWGDTLEPGKAMEAGTIFPGMDLPFSGGMRR